LRHTTVSSTGSSKALINKFSSPIIGGVETFIAEEVQLVYDPKEVSEVDVVGSSQNQEMNIFATRMPNETFGMNSIKTSLGQSSGDNAAASMSKQGSMHVTNI